MTVVSDPDERLDCIIFKDEAIVATFEPRKDGGAGADIADEPVTQLFGMVILFRPDVIHLFEADWDKHLEVGRRIVSLHFIKWYHRQAFVLWTFDIIAIQGERHYVVGRIVREIKMRQLRPLTGPEYYDLCHIVFGLGMLADSKIGVNPKRTLSGAFCFINGFNEIGVSTAHCLQNAPKIFGD